MSDHMSMTYVATGPRRGQTFTYRANPQAPEYHFVDGVLKVRNSPQALHFLGRYLASCVGAFPSGSAELEAADAKDAANGQLHIHANKGNGSVQGSVRPAGQNPSQGTNLLSGLNAGGPAARSEGLVPDGSGLRAADAVRDETRAGMIQAAVRKLDPTEDSHWTEVGKPAVAAVALALNDQTVTRAQVDAAMPEYSRDKAALDWVS